MHIGLTVGEGVVDGDAPGLLLWLGILAAVCLPLFVELPRQRARAGERAWLTTAHRLRSELVARVLAPGKGAEEGPRLVPHRPPLRIRLVYAELAQDRASVGRIAGALDAERAVSPGGAAPGARAARRSPAGAVCGLLSPAWTVNAEAGSGVCSPVPVFAVCMAGTTLPTPLYSLYQEKFGFSELTVTVVYAVYAFGVIGILLLGGNASDTVGRRPVLLWGLGLAAASAVCFLCATGLGWLYAGRLLSGFSAGLCTGAATAYVMDLAPPGGAARATLVATAANMGGLGCGPLLAGVLAQYADRPLYLPFAVHLVLIAGSAAVLARLPETVTDRGPDGAVRPQRPGLPPQVRTVFGPAAAASFAGFALFGVFTSVSPAFLARSLDVTDHAVSGLVVALAFFASIAGQTAVGRVGVARSLPLGCAVLLAGLALLAGALRWGLLALVVLSAAVGGAGQGMTFRGALSAVAAASPPEQRAAVISTLFVVAYTGISVPVIGVGVLVGPLGLEGADLVFIACMAVLVSLAAAYLLRRPVPAKG